MDVRIAALRGAYSSSQMNQARNAIDASASLMSSVCLPMPPSTMPGKSTPANTAYMIRAMLAATALMKMVFAIVVIMYTYHSQVHDEILPLVAPAAVMAQAMLRKNSQRRHGECHVDAYELHDQERLSPLGDFRHRKHNGISPSMAVRTVQYDPVKVDKKRLSISEK